MKYTPRTYENQLEKGFQACLDEIAKRSRVGLLDCHSFFCFIEASTSAS
jgi:hypothetical protein